MDRRQFLGTLPAAAAVATGLVAPGAEAGRLPKFELPPDFEAFRFMPSTIEELTPAIERLFPAGVGEMNIAWAEFNGDCLRRRIAVQTWRWGFNPRGLTGDEEEKHRRCLVMSMFMTFVQKSKECENPVLLWRMKPESMVRIRGMGSGRGWYYDAEILRCRAAIAPAAIITRDAYLGPEGGITKWPTPA